MKAVPQIQFSENAPRVRRDFTKISRLLEIPNLIAIQKQSFERFLQVRVEPEKRENTGLQAVFNSVFPITDFNDTASLEFVGYALEEPKYDVQECLQRGMTYATPFKVTIRLVAWDDAGGGQAIRDVKEQEVYFGEVPIMTDNGTFIINGTERVIVSQLHRSPGIFYDTSTSTTISAAGKKLFSCRVIPYRGSWLDIEFDHKDLIYARIDRRRKILVTVLLKALGYSSEDLLAYFYEPEMVRIEGKKIMKKVVPDLLAGQRSTKDVKDSSGKVITRKDRKFTNAAVRKIVEDGIEWIQIAVEDILRDDPVKRVAPIDIVDESTGEVIIECNEVLTQSHLDELKARGIFEFPLLYLDPLNTGTALHDTLLADKTVTREEAIIDIYRRVRTSSSIRSATTSLASDASSSTTSWASTRRSGWCSDPRARRVERRRFRSEICGPSASRTSVPRSSTWSTSRTDRIRKSGWMTSTTLATVACGSWVSFSRTSTASAWCGWSVPSRSECPSRRSRR
jgi:DNA-directed RNA polymerase subunit beta